MAAAGMMTTVLGLIECGVPVTREQVVDYLTALSPEQLRELIVELEDLWSIERPATVEPRYVTMGVALDGPELPVWSVILLDTGPQRIAVVKALREHSARSLSELKALVDAAPSEIAIELPRTEAEALHDRLVALGAKVELR